MKEREAEVNRDLRLLDDAHRLGQIGRAEYRARRRNVLARLLDAGAATERNPVQAAAQSTSDDDATVKKQEPVVGVAEALPRVRPAVMPAADAPAAVQVAAKSGRPWKAIAMLVAGLAVVAIALLVALRRPPLAVAVGEAGAPAAPVDSASNFETLADRFLADGRWDAEAVNGLASAWSAIDPATRATLRARPVFARLREQLAQRRKVVDLLLEGAAADDPKAREAASLKALDAALAAS